MPNTNKNHPSAAITDESKDLKTTSPLKTERKQKMAAFNGRTPTINTTTSTTTTLETTTRSASEDIGLSSSRFCSVDGDDEVIAEQALLNKLPISNHAEKNNGVYENYDDDIVSSTASKRSTMMVSSSREESKTVTADGLPVYKDTRWATDGRETWTTRTEFLLSVIGYAVDLANVWRFPYLAYKNGGGAFLIPYFTMLIFGALPVLFLELAVGQHYRLGPTLVWSRATPILKGVGYASIIISLYVSFYYNSLLGYALHYIFSSIRLTPLPWTSCNPEWASSKCTATVNVSHTGDAHVPAAQEYFDRGVFQTQHSAGFGDFGHIQWNLVGCTGIAYLVLLISLSRGVKSSGKVVYVTVILPYVLLAVLLARGVMLPGAANGILYYITPSFSKITSITVWIEAAVQVFYSSGAGFGVHSTLASFTKGHYPLVKNTLITCVCNCGTSIFAGFVVFTYIGYMAHMTNTDISTVANDGPGLAFYVYPEALGTLPFSHIWSILFFCMFFNLGIDSSLGGMESMVTGISDDWTFLNRFKYKRILIVVAVHVISFAMSTWCSTSGGIFALIWLDSFSAGISLVFVALLEAVCIAYCYGGPQFSADMKRVCNQEIHYFWRFCWKFTVPLLTIFIIVGSLVSYPLPTFSDRKDAFPHYSIVLGWIFCLSSVVFIPIYMVIQVQRQKGRTLREKFALSITPCCEHEELYASNFRDIPRFKLQHWLAI